MLSSAGLNETPRRCRPGTLSSGGKRRCNSRIAQGSAANDGRRHGVAAKVIATVDDLDRIAADDEADVPAIKGWRRELFGEKALALKHGHLALAVDKGKVVTVEKD